MTLLRNLAKSGLKPAALRAELAKRPCKFLIKLSFSICYLF